MLHRSETNDKIKSAQSSEKTALVAHQFLLTAISRKCVSNSLPAAGANRGGERGVFCLFVSFSVFTFFEPQENKTFAKKK